MVWEEAEGTKPPLAYDESEETKELDKKIIKGEQNRFTKEIKSGIAPDEKAPKQTPNEVIFDSKKGYKK